MKEEGNDNSLGGAISLNVEATVKGEDKFGGRGWSGKIQAMEGANIRQLLKISCWVCQENFMGSCQGQWVGIK